MKISVLAVCKSLCEVVAGRGRRANATGLIFVNIGAGYFKKSLAFRLHQLVSLFTLAQHFLFCLSHLSILIAADYAVATGHDNLVGNLKLHISQHVA